MQDTDVLKFDQTAEQYATHVQDAKEVIRQPLYDSATYAAAGQTSLSFFQTPKGQGGKTAADTNMELAGTLPMGKSFLVEEICLYALPSANPATATAVNDFLNDLYTIYKAGNLKFTISSKEYLNVAPLMMLPPKTGLEATSSAATTVAATSMNTNYASASGEIFRFSPANLMIVSNTNFELTLNWPTALALPSGTTAKLFIVLGGVMYRWVQ